MGTFDSIKKETLNFELILGLVILAIGAFILLKQYKILPSSISIPQETLILIAGIGCVIGGGFLLLKKLGQEKSYY